jgi:hypothetical protein
MGMVKKTLVKHKKTATAPSSGTYDAFKTAALVVSLTINVAIFVLWIILQVTTKYDEQVYNFLFNR